MMEPMESENEPDRETMPINAGAYTGNNGRDDGQPDTLPIVESQSQQSSSSSPTDKNKKGKWGTLMPHTDYLAAYEERQRLRRDQVKSLGQHESVPILCQKPLVQHSLIKDEYTAGRLEHLDIQFNEENTELTKLLSISKTQFIIRRERVTNYETADYKGDFVVVIYDKSSNGTFINKSKLINKKGILVHNDTISIARSNYEVYEYQQTTNSIELPSELAKNYVGLRTLGRGICGLVQLVYSKTDYCPYALKCIKKNGEEKTAHQDLLVDPQSFMNEVDILKQLKHINIIKMVHTINAPLNLFIMFELMPGGELFDRIKQNGGLPEKLAKFYFYQIATAVEYLHDKGITHRDLKPENILLLDNRKYTLVKVTDFGMSKLVNHETMMKTFCGTPYYAAPEILQSKGSSEYTSQVDIWSLGVILYVMLSSCVPFAKRDGKELNKVIIEGNYNYPPDKFDNVSDRAKRLINNMLIVRPSKRYTISNVVASSWLNDEELMTKIAALFKPYLNLNNNNNSENKSPNFDSGVGSSLHDIQKKRQRLE